MYMDFMLDLGLAVTSVSDKQATLPASILHVLQFEQGLSSPVVLLDGAHCSVRLSGRIVHRDGVGDFV
jgi:hypothetical protein